jgi:prepilin-type N-terminal cleavage/methylation domain-containing protein
MTPQRIFNRGFTLIELLVVIAIIGLLASIVLVSLNSARLKARDTKILSDANQIRNLMETEYASSGNYTNVKNGGNWNSCNASSGAYATPTNQACADIIANESGCPVQGATTMCVYFLNTSPDSPDKYTIIAYLPGASASGGASMYYCVGSSGRNSVSAGLSNGWVSPGCWTNP